LPALLGAGSTVVAVGVLRTLRRRRVRRGARLPLSTVPPPPPRSTRPVERELLAEADEAAVDALDVGLANLASGLRPRGGEPCPQPRLVQLTGERLEVLLDRAEPAVPPPWRPEASGLVWVLDEPGELPATPDAALPLPALVTVGVGESTMLIDLEAYGVVSLVGDPAACWGLARSMLTELSARTEGTVDVEVVGADLEAGVGELDGVRLVADWDGVDTGLIGGSARLLDAGRWPHTFAARASGRVFDGWAPAVWFTAHNDHPAYRAALEAIAARPGAGSAVVVVGEDPGCGLRVVLRPDGTFHIPELRLTGQTQLLTEGAVDQVAELFADADDLAVAQTFPFPAQPDGAVPTSGSPGLHTDVSDAVSGADPSGYSDPSFDVLVRVCGEIHVQGGKEPLPPRESAVVAYVALNGPVDIERVRDAVWGGIDISLKRVRNVVSVARRAVGDAIIIDGGRLLPGEGLMTDVELIRRRRAYAEHQADAAARVETLRGALEWVNWTWIELDRWISHVESLVGSVACTLAELRLELGDSDGACGAARRGLDATGQREELTLLLVQGYELAGDEPAARAALRSYERHMDELGAAEHSEALLRAMERYGQPRPGRAAG
jgi:DNA-binding SARP family transcriptional activator